MLYRVHVLIQTPLHVASATVNVSYANDVAGVWDRVLHFYQNVVLTTAPSSQTSRSWPLTKHHIGKLPTEEESFKLYWSKYDVSSHGNTQFKQFNTLQYVTDA